MIANQDVFLIVLIHIIIFIVLRVHIYGFIYMLYKDTCC